MHFDEQYIKECDCPEIQGLRIELLKGDWFYDKGFKYKPLHLVIGIEGTDYRIQVIWLPLSHQLDDKIVKICKEKELEYVFVFNESWGYIAEAQDLSASDEEHDVFKIVEDNPLIAKIKLLKALLKDK